MVCQQQNNNIGKSLVRKCDLIPINYLFSGSNDTANSINDRNKHEINYHLFKLNKIKMMVE